MSIFSVLVVAVVFVALMVFWVGQAVWNCRAAGDMALASELLTQGDLRVMTITEQLVMSSHLYFSRRRFFTNYRNAQGEMFRGVIEVSRGQAELVASRQIDEPDDVDTFDLKTRQEWLWDPRELADAG